MTAPDRDSQNLQPISARSLAPRNISLLARGLALDALSEKILLRFPEDRCVGYFVTPLEALEDDFPGDSERIDAQGDVRLDPRHAYGFRADGGKFSDEELSLLSGLTSLDLSYCSSLTDAGLVHLSGLTNLTRLNLWGCSSLTDAGLVHLSGLTNLTRLNLGRCSSLTDAGLVHLSGLTNLTRLNLRGCTSVTQVGVAWLQRRLPGCTIDADPADEE